MSKASTHGAILIGAYITTSALNYFFGVALSWFFTPAMYGVQGVAQSLLLLVSLAVGSGFAWSAAHDLASGGLNDASRRRYRTALLANSLLGVLVALGLWAAYALKWLPLGPEYLPIIPLVGLTTVFLAARAVVNGAARGLYRFAPVAVNLVLEVVVKLIVGLGLVAAGWGAEGVMIGFAAGAMASLVHAQWIVRKDGLMQGGGWVDRQVLAATAPLFVSMLGVALMLNLDVLGLKLLSPASQGDTLAGYYQAAVVLARTPVFIAQAVTLVVFSYAAGQSAGAQAGDKASFVLSSLRSWWRLLVPIALVLILAPSASLGVFFPAHYQAASLALTISSLGCLLLALATLLTGVFQAQGQRSLPAVAAAVAVGAQVLTLVVAVPRFGALAAAFSLVVAGLVSLAIMLPLLWPQVKALLALSRRGQAVTLLREALPILAPVAILLFVPNGSRLFSLAKLLSAGLAYGVTLMAVHAARRPQPARPLLGFVSQFVQVIMGG